MHIFFWVLQVLLALHTVVGAIWKFSNSEQNIPSLSNLPHSVWLGLSIVELLCSAGLLLPALNKKWGSLTPLAAGFIAAEMLLYCGVHLASGTGFNGQMVYWLVVTVYCAFLMYGRLVLKPFKA